MSTAVAANISLVWLVNNEDSLSAVESRNLIRAKAATWGHTTRRHGHRNVVRSKASDLHSNVFDHGS
jgi:hypothetical protein